MSGIANSVKLRHIVFADAARRKRFPIDLTPRLLVPMSLADGNEEAGSTHEEEAFVRWLFMRASLDVRMYRMETLNRRLNACLRVLHCDNVREARLLLSQNAHLVPAALSTLVIGVTSFFRDQQVFQRLQDDVLPSLCARGRSLRIWSVGCSDGQELYSIAMLLAQSRVLHACYLLGTDCRADAIGRLVRGTYDNSALRHVPAELRAEYFDSYAEGWRIKPSIRSAVRGRIANALRVLEPGPWDLICCRNMAMYLQPKAATALWQSLERHLSPGGVLVLGKAERPVGVKGLAYIGPCLYRREGTRDAAPPIMPAVTSGASAASAVAVAATTRLPARIV